MALSEKGYHVVASEMRQILFSAMCPFLYLRWSVHNTLHSPTPSTGARLLLESSPSGTQGFDRFLDAMKCGTQRPSLFMIEVSRYTSGWCRPGRLLGTALRCQSTCKGQATRCTSTAMCFAGHCSCATPSAPLMPSSPGLVRFGLRTP